MSVNGDVVAIPTINWKVSDLLLDAENPRLPDDYRSASQPELIAYMEKQYDLEELGWSMVMHGYFGEEPLLVIPVADRPEKRIVVEGNRRLATLKLLTDRDTRQLVGKTIWYELADLAVEESKDLRSVPVREYPSRVELLEYLGFRHVSGLMQWEAEAKARFVYRLVTEYGYNFEQVARTIGGRPDAIRRQYVAWSAVVQARNAGVDVTPGVRRFGVLYRSFQSPGTREFLHLQGWTDATPELREPLAEDGPQRFDELQGFVFGPDRVIKESRRLDDLAKVLAEPVALEVLRQERDVDVALRELPNDRTAVLASMRTAYRALTAVNGQVYEFAGDRDLIAEAQRILRVVDLILRTLGQEATPAS